MRRLMLIAVFMLASAPSLEAQTLPPLPSRAKPLNPQVWQTYSREVLLSLFPLRASLVRELKIDIMEDDAFAAETNSSTVTHIRIATGLIRRVADKEEYAGVLAHEMIHCLLLHGGVQTVGLWANWSLERRQELLADFGSIIVSPRPQAVLAVLDRMIPLRLEDLKSEPKEYQFEAARTLFLQHASLEKLIAKQSAAIVPAGKLPGPMPSKTASLYDWETYAGKLLEATYPSHANEIGRIFVTSTTQFPDPYVIYSIKAGDTIEIAFDVDRIAKMKLEPKEFATLLGDEFGHILLGSAHREAIHATGFLETAEEAANREEAAADLVAILPLYRGECHLARALKKLVRNVRDEMSPELRAFNEERIQKLQRMCAWNY